MRVAIVTHTVGRNDGQGRVNYEVARAALRRGHHVVLVSTDVDSELLEQNRVHWVEIPVHRIPTQLLRNVAFAAQSTVWLMRHRGDIDVVLSNGAITWFASDVNVVHFVHTAWLRSPVRSPSLSARHLYHWLYTAVNAWTERFAFRQARQIVAVSDRVRTELVNAGVPANCIHVIPNGVNLDEFAPGSEDRKMLDLPPRVPLALFIGDLQTPRKNLDTVLEALTQTPELHLAVAGSIDDSPYPGLARALNLEHRVHFLGFRKDIPHLMRAADLCVCPSRYEPFSLVVLEAMASGCPVVTAKCVGAATLLPPDAGIVLDDPEDVSALARALRTITDAPQRRARMGEVGRRAARSFDWNRTGDGYVRLLEHSHQSTFAPAS